MSKIKGTYCASLTPLNADLSIDSKLLLNHCNHILSQNINGIAIFGTTGEANSLSLEQKIESIEYLIKNNFDPNKLIVGTGLNSITDTIKFTKIVSTLNVKTVLVLPPSYYKNITSEGIVDYYSRLVEEVNETNLSYLLYHIPQMSGVNIDFNVIEKLLSKYSKNIVGIKDSSGDEENTIKMAKVFSEFSILSGSDSFVLKLLKNGGAGAITATSNISAKLLAFIFNNFQNSSTISNFELVNTQMRTNNKCKQVFFLIF